MIEFQGYLFDIEPSEVMKKTVVTLILNGSEPLVLEGSDIKKDELVDIKISKHREKRSLNANAYAWKLINELANVMRLSKDEVYLKMLKQYGQSDLVSVLSRIDVKPYFKYYEEVGRSTLQGKEFTHYRIFKGSSEYNSREMSILIDGIVQECREQKIETIPPEELKRMLSSWKA